MASRMLNLGAWCPMSGVEGGPELLLPAKHLVTHAAIVGMTGSGKTGLVTVLVEEALRAGIPTLVIDIKGDLPNLLLTFPSDEPEAFRPWLEKDGTPLSPEELLEETRRRKEALALASLDDTHVRRFSDKVDLRVITPGSSAGESLHVLSPLERRSSRWDTDPESAQSALSAAVSLVLRLLGRDPDPAKSKDHVLLSVLAERRLRLGEQADISALMQDLLTPPIETVGALPINSFMKKNDRQELASALNSLLASPTFASWREGVSLDVGEWLKPRGGMTPGVVLSVAHLDDEERSLVLGVVFEEILSWVRSLRGTSELKALVVFDEVYSFLPPHPANPPTKRPIVALMKQARAFGVGVVLATQNPMDLDYRALSNAGLWCIGRLQTDADRARVTEGLASSIGAGMDAKELNRTVSRLAPRCFVMRNAHVPEAGTVLLHPRQTMSLMRGPLTREELKQARELRAGRPRRTSSRPRPSLRLLRGETG